MRSGRRGSKSLTTRVARIKRLRPRVACGLEVQIEVHRVIHLGVHVSGRRTDRLLRRGLARLSLAVGGRGAVEWRDVPKPVIAGQSEVKLVGARFVLRVA